MPASGRGANPLAAALHRYVSLALFDLKINLLDLEIKLL